LLVEIGEAIVRVAIRGRVQGVGYRYWLAQRATARGLEGWVRNRRDGSVELRATGEDAAVKALIEACRQGPRAAIVSDVAVSDAEDDGSEGFSARPTV
jgi:acylphosphatase